MEGHALPSFASDLYPGSDSSYGVLLFWHLYEWGTNPKSIKTERSDQVDEAAFANKVCQANTAIEAYNASKSLRNWTDPRKAPPKVWEVAKRVQRQLFYDEELKQWNPLLIDWADDLWAARARHYKGNVSRQTYRDHDPSPPRIEPSRSSRIPKNRGRFLGRENDLNHIIDILYAKSASTLILVQGGPGIGKTELTKVLGHHGRIMERFGERRWFVPLEQVKRARDMRDAIINEIGGSPGTTLDLAMAPLQGQQSLIILDNLDRPWEVLDQREATEELLAELIGITGVSIVASFRGQASIRLPNWQPLFLRGLPPDAGRELFVSICGPWAQRDARLQDFVDVLGGIPLAIELVARRAYGRDNLTLLWEEWERVGVKIARDSSLPAGRLTSLPQSIEFSLLSPRMTKQAMTLFRLLGQFPDGLTHVDIRYYLDEEDHLEAEETLLGVGLAVETPGRIDLLPPIRDFARRFYPPTDNHADTWPNIMLSLSEYVGKGTEDSEYDALFVRLQSDVNNIEVALKSRLESEGDCEDLILSLTGLRNLLESKCQNTLIFEKFASRFREEGNDLLEGLCLSLSGDIKAIFRDFDAAEVDYLKALRLLSKQGDILFEANVLGSLGDIERKRGNLRRAEELYLDAKARHRQVKDRLGEANSIARLANIHFSAEDYEGYKAGQYQALKIYREIDVTFGIATCWMSIGEAEFLLRDYHEAEKHLDQARHIFHHVGDIRHQIICLKYLGDIALINGETLKAKDIFTDIVKHDVAIAISDNIKHALEQLSVIDRQSREQLVSPVTPVKK